MSEEKLARIETALAHQDRQIQDLSEMIGLQWKEIDRLKLRLEKTQNKISEMEANTDIDQNKAQSVSEIAALEKPPHY